MSILRGDASEIYALAGDLSSVTGKIVPAIRAAMDQAGRDFAAAWAENAVETAGEHGKHYPKSIDSELTFGLRSVAVDVGPNSDKKQGGMGMGFEFGSQNQPPHLDGMRAMESIAPHVEDLIASAVGGTFVAATPVANPNDLVDYTTKAGVTRKATQAQVDNWTRGSR